MLMVFLQTLLWLAQYSISITDAENLLGFATDAALGQRYSVAEANHLAILKLGPRRVKLQTRS